jgi:hypothetical protein
VHYTDVQTLSVGPRACVDKSLGFGQLRDVLVRLIRQSELYRDDLATGMLKGKVRKGFVVERSLSK